VTVLGLADSDIRAIETARGWTKVRAGSLHPDVVLINGEPTSVIVFTNDEDGAQRIVPRHQILAFDGDLTHQLSPEEQRAYAWHADEQRRRDGLGAGRWEVNVGPATLTFKAPGELSAEQRTLVVASLEVYIDSDGRSGLDAVIETMLAGWTGRPQIGQFLPSTAVPSSGGVMSRRVERWQDVIDRAELTSRLGVAVPGLLTRFRQTPPAPPASNGNGHHPEPTAPRRK
jgi:hypothetical protein